MTMLGPSSFKKAIEEAEKLSGSLKLRFGHLSFHFFFLLSPKTQVFRMSLLFCYFSPFEQIRGGRGKKKTGGEREARREEKKGGNNRKR